MPDAEGKRPCMLPGGYVDDEGQVHREAEMAVLTGHDEELLVSMPGAPSAVLVTRLLARCVKRLGTITPVTEDVARRLLIADRQFLLLQLRAATFGERIAGVLACPWQGCGARIDIDFLIDEVPVKRCETVAASYQLRLSPEAEGTDAHGRRTLTFRLPDGGDQEVVAPLLGNAARALTRLLERCVLGLEAPGDTDVPTLVAGLSPRVRYEIEQAMAAHAPAIELDMDVVCPECGRAFTAPFDLQDFFFGELRTSRDLLYRQVHYLAYHYHWSEHDILALPRDKRRTYIEIIADEIEALNHAV